MKSSEKSADQTWPKYIVVVLIQTFDNYDQTFLTQRE